MNNQHRQVEKIILRQMEDEQLPLIPKNRHQRRAASKVKK